MRMDGRTDRYYEANSRFSQSGNALDDGEITVTFNINFFTRVFYNSPLLTICTRFWSPFWSIRYVDKVLVFR